MTDTPPNIILIELAFAIRDALVHKQKERPHKAQNCLESALGWAEDLKRWIEKEMET